MSHPLVSVVIPCRNEVAHISPCLDSILATGYPKDRLEVLAIDGMSTDGTREILAEYARRHLIITVLNNPKQTIPAAMNIGILHARGDVIMKMDAHSMYSRHYVSRCVAMMDTYGADNVGGFIVARPSAPTAVARAIAAALSHPFGTLNSHFKLGTDAPRWVDTVAFGCYRKEVFARVGLYDENLTRSSDMDFNIRLRKAGGRILLIPEAINYYYLRSDLIGFWWHNYEDGYWATYPLKFGRRVFAWRHLAPAMLTVLFAIALVGAVWAYWLLWFSALLLSVYAGVSLLSSLQIARRGHDWRSLGVMPIIFAIRHLGYALGSLVGLVAALLSLVSRGRMPGRQLSRTRE